MLRLSLGAICGAVLVLTGCATSSSPVKELNTQETTWKGKAPKTLVHVLDANNNVMEFIDAKKNKYGHARVMVFGKLYPGEYSFKAEGNDGIAYEGTHGVIDFSSTSSTAAVFVNEDTFRIMKSHPGKLTVFSTNLASPEGTQVGQTTQGPQASGVPMGPVQGVGQQPALGTPMAQAGAQSGQPNNEAWRGGGNQNVINPWAKDPANPYPTIFPNVKPGELPPLPTGQPGQGAPEQRK